MNQLDVSHFLCCYFSFSHHSVGFYGVPRDHRNYRRFAEPKVVPVAHVYGCAVCQVARFKVLAVNKSWRGAFLSRGLPNTDDQFTYTRTDANTSRKITALTNNCQLHFAPTNNPQPKPRVGAEVLNDTNAASVILICEAIVDRPGQVSPNLHKVYDYNSN
ncbi:hypothetical protein quinque_012058 [Culex quinquefasciatus]